MNLKISANKIEEVLPLLKVMFKTFGEMQIDIDTDNAQILLKGINKKVDFSDLSNESLSLLANQVFLKDEGDIDDYVYSKDKLKKVNIDDYV